MRDHCGAFLVLDIGELAEDRFLTEDVPFLPPFEIALASGDTAAEKAALKRFADRCVRTRRKIPNAPRGRTQPHDTRRSTALG